jgi:hypothetical protein
MVSVLVLAMGLTYRALAARLSPSISKTPIDAAALEQFPMQISSWIGEDVPLDDAVVRRTGSDAHINRRYSRPHGSGSVCLYIACGVRPDEVVAHRPAGCYAAAGWTLVSWQAVELQLNGEERLPCSILQFSRKGLVEEKAAVLHYFIVDGQPLSDVSQLQSRIWRIFTMADCVAQVHILASTRDPGSDSTAGLITTFALDSASSVTRLFESIGKGRGSKESRLVAERE